MADKKFLNIRLVHKHDTEANWLKATNFIPKQGELIVYDTDSSHTYERIKMGDGQTVVSSLPFILDNEIDDILAQLDAVSDAISDLQEAVDEKALASDLTTHTGNGTIHVTATDKSNWNGAKTLVDSHTANDDIHFTATERTKLAGIESGAQKNTVTGVKGNSEPTYRTGNINITKANIGLGNVEDTSDANKPVSTAQQNAIDGAKAEAKQYTDDKIALVMNNSSTAVDSVMELAQAMEDNEDVVAALDEAVGKKANSSDLTSHTGDTTVHITAAERTDWNSKQAAITGGASTITSSDLSTNKVLISNGSGKVAVSDVTSTELGYLSGVTSSVQGQLDNMATKAYVEELIGGIENGTY